jgi:hypothetical protein
LITPNNETGLAFFESASLVELVVIHPHAVKNLTSFGFGLFCLNPGTHLFMALEMIFFSLQK